MNLPLQLPFKTFTLLQIAALHKCVLNYKFDLYLKF